MLYVLYVDNAMVLFDTVSTQRTEYMACDALPVWHEYEQHFTDTENSQTVISHFHNFSSIRAERRVSSGVSVHNKRNTFEQKKKLEEKRNNNQTFCFQFNSRNIHDILLNFNSPFKEIN